MARAVMKYTIAANRERALAVFDRLRRAYPEATCSLDHRIPLQLLVATILAAQCTDERVNKVTPALFKRYKTARAFANAPALELEELVRTCGFFRLSWLQ